MHFYKTKYAPLSSGKTRLIHCLLPKQSLQNCKASCISNLLSSILFLICIFCFSLVFFWFETKSLHFHERELRGIERGELKHKNCICKITLKIHNKCGFFDLNIENRKHCNLGSLIYLSFAITFRGVVDFVAIFGLN